MMFRISKKGDRKKIPCFSQVHSLKLTANAPENRQSRKETNRILIIHFQVDLLLVSGRVHPRKLTAGMQSHGGLVQMMFRISKKGDFEVNRPFIFRGGFFFTHQRDANIKVRANRLLIEKNGPTIQLLCLIHKN